MQRERPDYRKLARAVIQLAMAEAEAEAMAEGADQGKSKPEGVNQDPESDRA